MMHLEPLQQDELAFIERRYNTESKLYVRTMNVLLVIGTLAPLLVCLILMNLRGGERMPIKVVYSIYFIGFAFMMFFVGLIAFVAYRAKILAYKKDKTEATKIVEAANIIQKKYMKLNDSYHFYLNSPNKYTIEVSANDFKKWQLGDEIKIEYARHSKEYFGYF